jgi:lipoprotein-anchoring transpeptidase ErfK/SrfK
MARRRRKKSSPLPLIFGLIVLAVVAYVGYRQLHGNTEEAPADTPPADRTGSDRTGDDNTARTEHDSDDGGTADPHDGAEATKPAQPTPPLPDPDKPVPEDLRREAADLTSRGLTLLAQEKVLPARAALADALNTGALPPADEAKVRKHLARIADVAVFSGKVLEGDRCAFYYRFKPGDVLVQVERSQSLRVPTQIILRINGIEDARKIQAGQRVKLIRGPFHAVVDKSQRRMDLYQEEPQTGRMIFVRRLPVGVGKDGSTPPGRWRVAHGGKMTHAAWTPPASSDLRRKKILWGEPDYPLGKKGYWISLEGIREEGNPHTREDGYGIHGTDDPSSIGRAVSLGCIRLADDGIELVFSLLYEKHSTVTILE